MTSLNQRLPLALLLLRLSVFLVMLMWTLDKFLNPEHAAAIYKNFYLIGGLGNVFFYVIGTIQLIIIFGNQQIVDIYTDNINNWQEVGGKDASITVVHKSAGRATREVFLNFFELQPQQVVADTIIGENEQGIKTVAGNANAIGYVSIGAAQVHQEDGTAIKLLPLQGTEASLDAVSQGKFPLSRPLNLVTKGEPTGLAQDFIEFAQSSQVHDTIQAQSFSPVSQ